MKPPLVLSFGPLVLYFSVSSCAGSAQDRSKDLIEGWNRHVSINALTFSPDGRFLAAGSGRSIERGEVAVWDVGTSRLRTFQSFGNGIPSVAFSPDSKTLAAGSFGEHCYLLDAATGQVQATLSGHGEAARGIAFSPDGQTLAVGSYDKSIRFWDYRAGKLAKTLTGHTKLVYGLAYSPDGKLLASTSSDRTIRLWEARSGNLVHIWKDAPSGSGIAFHPKENWLITPCELSTIVIRDPSSEKKWQLFAEGWRSIAIHPSGKTFALAGPGNTARVHSLDLRDATAAEQARARALIARWKDDSYEVREKASQELRKMGLVADPILLQAMNEAASAEVRLRARLTRVEIRTLIPTAALEGHRDEVLSCTYSPDGQTLATSGRDGLVFLWDAASYQLKGKLEWPEKGP